MFTGVYCTEERHEEDVCDEVHEQEPDHQEGCCAQCVQGDRDTENSGTSIPRQPLVYIPGKPD